MLHIIASESTIENRRELLRRYKQSESVKTNYARTAYFVVPEQATLQTDVALMEELGQNCLMDLRVVSFEKLSQEVLAVTAGLKRAYIDGNGKSMVLRTIFEDFGEEFQLYRLGAQNQGFLMQAVKFMTELKRSEITSENLEKLYRKRATDVLFAQKMKEISIMQEKLSEVLAGHYADNEDRMNMLAQQIEHAQYLREIDFYFYGFNSFTGIEYRILEQLLKSNPHIYLALPLSKSYAANNAVFSTTKETFRKLREICTNISCEMTVDYLEEKEEGEISFLGKELFSYLPRVWMQAPRQIMLTANKSVEEELHDIARKIRALIQNKGYRYRDIGVCVTEPQQYFKTAKRIFRLYDIPVFVDEKKALTESPIIKAICSLLDTMARGLSYESLFSFLKAGFTEFSMCEIEILENYFSSYKIQGTSCFREEYFQRGECSEQEREELLCIAKNLKDLLKPFYDRTRKKNTVSYFAEQTVLFLMQMQLPQKAEKFSEELKCAGMSEFADENRQVWDIFISVIEQMEELVGKRRVTVGEFRDILFAGVQNHKVGILPPSQDQVVLGTLDRSRMEQAKHLFVIGLCDGFFPKVRKEVSLITQEERSMMKESGFVLPSLESNLQAEECLSLYLNITSAQEFLYLSYALADCNGKPLRASYYIDKIREIFPQLVINTTREYGAETVYTLPALSENLAKHLREAMLPSDFSAEEREFWLEALRYVQNQKDKEQSLYLRKALHEKSPSRYVSKDRVRPLYGDKVFFSASGLEQFALCPYRHFVRYALSPQKKESYDFEVTDMGLLLHQCIDEFTEKIKNNPPLLEVLQKEYRDDLMDKIFERRSEEFANKNFEKNARNEYFLRKTHEVARMTAQYVFRQFQSGKFSLWGQEVDFGRRRELAAITLLEGEAYLHGRIDRVDVLQEDDKTYVKVIDYKTGKKEFSLSDVWQGFDLQLLFYLYAVLQSYSFGEDKAFPAGAFYFPAVHSLIHTEEEDEMILEKLKKENFLMDGIALKEEKILRAIDESIEAGSSVFKGAGRKKFDEKENLLTAGEFHTLMQHAMKLAQTMAIEILNGKTEVSPILKNGDRRACDFCNYKSICRFDERKSAYSYRRIKDYKNEEIKEKIAEEQCHE